MIKARQRKKVKIVRPEWLYHSIGKWQRQDESKYLLEAPKKSTPAPSTPVQATDADDETGAEEEDQGGVSEGMDENHIPLSINKEEVNEHLKTVNWDDMGKEVEDFVGDLDDTDFDSDTRLATFFFFPSTYFFTFFLFFSSFFDAVLFFSITTDDTPDQVLIFSLPCSRTCIVLTVTRRATAARTGVDPQL